MADELTLISSDKKYRQYMTEVERALRAFEYTSEWADLIAALGRLNKVLTQNNKYQVIPRRHIIGKRLAQCLHPALPSGVHLKCLETYDIIFQAIGKEKLVEDLFIYGSGIFPLLGQAAMNVKPMLLTVIETHLLKLGAMLRPALTGMVVGLLPGLEEGAETYDRVNALLEQISHGVGLSYFYSAIWEAMLLSASVRCQAASFVLTHFNKKQTLDDQLHILGRSPGVMVQAISSSLLDPNILVQRSTLDVLLLCFPLHSPHLTKQDHLNHMLASLKVLLRRDMSLNRRLYAWLLGTDSNGVSLLPVNFQLSMAAKLQTPGAGNEAAATAAQKERPVGHVGVPTFHYLDVYSKDLLVQSLVQLARNPDAWTTGISMETRESRDSTASNTSERLKLFRILMTLLEKPEIGPLIIEDVLIEIFRFLYHLCLEEKRAAMLDKDGTEIAERTSPQVHFSLSPGHFNAGSSEVVKTANLLFSSFEPYYMWDYLGRLFYAACHYTQVPDQELKSDQALGEFPWDVETVNRLRGKTSILELCDLISFLLDNASLETYPETQTEHLPSLLYHIICSMTRFVNALGDRELTSGLGLCTKLLGKVMPSMGLPEDGRVMTIEGAVEEETADDASDASTSHEASPPPASPARNSPLVPTPPSPTKIQEDDDDDDDPAQTGQDGASPKKLVAPARPAHPPRTNSPLKSYPRPESPLMPSVGTSPLMGDIDSLAPQDLLQACLLSFHEFFTTLVIKRIFGQKEVLSQCLQMLSVSSLSSSTLVAPITPQLDSLTPQRQDVSHGRFLFPPQDPHHAGRHSSFHADPTTGDGGGGALFTDAFALACQLLVEFCSFPRYQSSLPQDFYSSSASAGTGIDALPSWVKCLFASSCFVNSFAIQKAAIATTLDLINLTQTVVSQQAAAAASASTAPPQTSTTTAPSEVPVVTGNSAGNVSVVLTPALSIDDLDYLTKNSRYFHLVANELWRWLSELHSDRHKTAVELLLTLHQVAPSPRICEDIISRGMSSGDVVERLTGFKKFFTAWHLTRELRLPATPSLPLGFVKRDNLKRQSKNTPDPPPPRTFHRSLLLGLDALDSPSDPCRGLSLTWLTHAIQRGDIARILEPLLLILLHPDTARISVQHVHVQPPAATTLSRCASSPTRPPSTAATEAREHVDAMVYNLSSRESDTPTTIFHVALPYQSNLIKEKLVSPKSPIPLQDYHAITAKDVEMDAILDRVKSVSTPNGPSIGSGVVPGPTDVTIWINDVQYLLPSHLLGDGARTQRHNTNANAGEGYFDDGEAHTGENGEIVIKVDHFLDNNDMASVSEHDSSSDSESEVIRRPRGDAASASQRNRRSDASIPHSRTATFKDAELQRDVSGSFGAGGNLKMPARGRSLSASTPTLNTAGAGSFTESYNANDNQSAPSGKVSIPSIHSHMLLYSQLYDTQRSLYALLKLRTMISASPRLFLCAIATKNMSSATTPFLSQIQSLLSRHRNAIFGRNFYSALQPDNTFRNSMYLEVLISVLLYYVRGYFPNLLNGRISRADVVGNKQVQTIAAEVLSLLLSELVVIVRESGHGFATYINDVMARCKVQKAILHCLSASVYNTRNPRASSAQSNGVDPLLSQSITESIIHFNEEVLDSHVVEAFQMQLLRLVLSIMILEDQLVSLKASGITGSSLSAVGKSTPAPPSVTGGNFNAGVEAPDATTNDKMKTNIGSGGAAAAASGSSVRYVPGLPCAQQNLFLSALLGALRQQHMCHMHRHWVTMAISSLPYVGNALRPLATSIVNQTCRNLELLAVEYTKRAKPVAPMDDGTASISSSVTSGYAGSTASSVVSNTNAKTPKSVPPDHVITLLEGMTTICHYALLDSPSPLAALYPTPGSGGLNYDGASAAQILSNLVNAFSSVDPSKEGTKNEEYVKTYSSPVLEARKGLLSIMPRIISGLALLWNSVSDHPYVGGATGRQTDRSGSNAVASPPSTFPTSGSSTGEADKLGDWTWGDPKLIRQFILEFLSPICLLHGVNMLGAVAVVWNERQRRASASITDSNVSKVAHAFGPDQHLLVDIVSAIKVLPTDTLIQTVKLVLKSPPPTNQDATSKKKCPLEVSVLQFFYVYLQRLTSAALVDAWPALLSLLKDGLSLLDLVPQGKFLLLTILDDFVKRTPQLEERSDIRNLQDITTKIVTDISAIAGSSLEQKSWLSKTYVVKAGNQGVALDSAEGPPGPENLSDDAVAPEDADDALGEEEEDYDDDDDNNDDDDDDTSSVASTETATEASIIEEEGEEEEEAEQEEEEKKVKKKKKLKFRRKKKKKAERKTLQEMAVTGVSLGLITMPVPTQGATIPTNQTPELSSSLPRDAANAGSASTSAPSAPSPVDVAASELPPSPGLQPHLHHPQQDISKTPSPTQDAQFSVPALHLLAEVLAPLLDIVFGNDEKDRVVNLLYSIMYYVFPYLKNHTLNNVPSFRACSQLLASLSSYAYVRRAWKKEAFDLLMDPQFFQMDLVCIGYWRTIIDHLMSYERVVFKDLMTRVTLPTNNINLFGSREAEYEQRSALLKRLAFVIFASDVDQYQKSMPEIQERLSEALRFQDVPNLHATVFLCYRVLLLRMTPHHLTSLWPTISTELVHVLLLLEECISQCPDFESSESASDAPSAVQALAARASDPSWLSLFLAACKLLDLVTTLPADLVPQFQLYRWAFIGGEQQPQQQGRGSVNRTIGAALEKGATQKEKDTATTNGKSPTFVPHIHRLSLLGNRKFFGGFSRQGSSRESTPPTLRVTPGRLLLNQTQIKSPKELVPFFNALGLLMSNPSTSLAAASSSVGGRKAGLSTMQLIEKAIERDLVEPLPAS